MKNKTLNIIGILVVIITTFFAVHNCKGNKMAGIDKNNMDLSFRPGDDFYSFAGAGWRRNNPLTGEYSRYGVFDKLRQENLEKLHKIIKDSSDKKISILYAQAMNKDKLNSDGIKPIIPTFEKIDKISDRKMLFEFLGTGHKHSDAFWDDAVEEDIKDSDHYLYTIGQGGLGLPEREYYFDNDTRSKEIREKYGDSDELNQKYMNQFK